jgi:uncharacterized protein YkwD
VVLGGADAAQAAECAVSTGTPGSEESESEFERATACAINEERDGRGLARVERTVGLDRVAKRYVRDMVARGFFAHVSPDGADLLDRVRTSRYLRGRPGFRIAEVLAWGAGELASPRAIVRAWLESRGHAQIIVGATYRDVGIAVAAGVPQSDAAGATYAVIFARRSEA